MKVLLTHAYFIQEDPKELQIMKPYPPLGILSIAAWLRERNFDVEVLDSTFSSFDDLIAEIRRDPPDAIGVYTNLMTRPRVLDLVDALREHPATRNLPVILGGPEVTHHVDALLDAGADYCVIGEGEESMQQLLETIRDGGDVSEVDGIAWRKSGEDGSRDVVRNRPRERMKRIDHLPTPARDLIDLDRYIEAWRSRHGAGSVSVSTMRGCPFSCRWCSRAVYGASYRRRPASGVVEELREIKQQYEPEAIWFVDDVFTISPRWMREFAEEMDRAGIDLRYECITRADRLDDEMIELLAASGCFRVWIGAESGSQRILDAMDRRVEASRVREMIRKCRERGIETGTFIMLGYPGETEEDILATIEHLRDALPDHFTVTTTYPITGTPLYEEVEESIMTDRSWRDRTDRDLDFPRPYPRSYYRWALRRMTNSVEHARYRERFPWNPRRLVHQLKALVAALGMFLTRRFGQAE